MADGPTDAVDLAHGSAPAMDPADQSPGAGDLGDGAQRRRLVIVVLAVAAAALVFVLQARLVNGAHTGPLHGGHGELPASLGSLAAGPGPVAVDLPFAVTGGGADGSGGPIASAPPSPTGTATQGTTGAASGGPQPLAAWAAEVGPRVGVPPVALAAYGAAQLALAAAQPACHLSWPTLAGLGSVESDHGRFAGAVLGPDGRSTPLIIGVPLDGAPGVARIADSDGGRLDGDPTLDRAVGPMQFIPGTWARWGADGDGDGAVDPFDIDDAALSAARYLCAAGGDLATGVGWTRAVYAYNASDNYVISVRERADGYADSSQP